MEAPLSSSLLRALEEEPRVSVRINRAKITEMDGVVESVPHALSGFFLGERPSFTEDPLFQAGAYYVQDASSMIVESLGEYLSCFGSGVRVLDLCAAPGGKSTHLLSLLRECSGSMLVANEVIRSRAAVLAENIAKWGDANVVVTNNDPSDFKSFKEYFDLILVDAPCSGEGMFRKDPSAIEEWSEENVLLCAARQKRIVADIWGSLKSGGILAYSTCTFSREENEENVEWIVSRLGATLLRSFRFYPGMKGAGEGLFFAILKKDGESEGKQEWRAARRREDTLPFNALSADLLSEGYSLYRKGDILKAFPTDLSSQMIGLESLLKVISSGVAVADIVERRRDEKGKKGRDADFLIVPRCELVQSLAYKRGAYMEVDIDYSQAQLYIRKEPLAFENYPKGYLLLTYRGVPLGLVKNLGSRANNLWPSSRRVIKKR